MQEFTLEQIGMQVTALQSFFDPDYFNRPARPRPRWTPPPCRPPAMPMLCLC